MRSEILIVLSLIAAVPMRADTLSDLRAVLLRYRGRDPLTASIEMTRSRHSKGRFVNDDFEGTASAQVDDSAAGLRITFARSFLDRAAADSAVSKAAAELLPMSIETAVDFAPSLVLMLSRARLTAQRNESVRGRSVRTLVLTLTAVASSDDDPGSVSFREDHLTISVGADGVPVSGQRVRKGSAGMLFIHIDTVRTESWDFTVYGDHLVAARTDDTSVVSGPMQNGKAKSVWIVRASR